MSPQFIPLKLSAYLFLLISMTLLPACVSRKDYNELLSRVEKAEKLQDQYQATYDRLMMDSDGDGIRDTFDFEVTTDSFAVDANGVTRDSDMDGIPDNLDKELFSPRLPVNEEGIAQRPELDVITESDANRIVDGKLAKFELPSSLDEKVYIVQFQNIYFNPNQAKFIADHEMDLHQTAKVLKDNPAIRLVVTGLSHPSGNSCQDDLLSFQRAKTVIDLLTNDYGISRYRLVLNFMGSNGMQFKKRSLNDRVEVDIANGQSEMSKPQCN